MRNVLQRRERCVREPLTDALSHVRTGDRVEHSPDESQRHIGRLEYLRPALGVLPAVLDVADQEMGDLLPVVLRCSGSYYVRSSAGRAGGSAATWGLRRQPSRPPPGTSARGPP